MAIKGVCNQCGHCCYVGAFKCEYLDVGGIPGMPMATRCRVYDKRFTDMPILLADPYGNVKQGYCLHGSAAEEVDLASLIRQGQCSMEIGED